MRLILTILLISSVACSEGEPALSDAQGDLGPSSCVFDQTVMNHDFLNWPNADADKYSCDLMPRATCEYFESEDERELRCVQDDLLNPPDIPSDCHFWAAGMSTYSDGVIRQGAVYRCNDFAGVWCRFSVSSFTGHREMNCYRQ